MKNNKSFEQLQEMLQLSLSCGMPAAAKLDLIRAPPSPERGRRRNSPA
jgi:hypothetical protein